MPPGPAARVSLQPTPSAAVNRRDSGTGVRRSFRGARGVSTAVAGLADEDHVRERQGIRVRDCQQRT